MGETKKNIFQTIAAVMEDVGAVGKDSLNEQQKFKYRGIDAVMNALNPAFIKHHLFIVPEVMDQTREERRTAKGGMLLYSVCRMKYTFYAEDGSHIEAVVVGEGMDSGDKATNKAMSVAFKYACFQVFCIPTEEMKDPDAETPPASEKAPELASEATRNVFLKECDRIGKSPKCILKAIGVDSLEHLTVERFQNAMKSFKNTPDKSKGKVDPATVPPEDETSGLPFN